LHVDEMPGVELVAPPRPLLVDGQSRTFWSRGAPASETLVEASAGGVVAATVGRRVSAMVAAQEGRDGGEKAATRRPVADPAFSEAVFVELMRAGQYERAFGLLAPECQERWGSATAFTREQEGLARLVGVEVHAVRYLPEWSDGERSYRDVAELDAAYTLRSGHRSKTVPRTVHLVAVDGRWRSLCWPSE
jgi:hypothetical protein